MNAVNQTLYMIRKNGIKDLTGAQDEIPRLCCYTKHFFILHYAHSGLLSVFQARCSSITQLDVNSMVQLTFT